jgi:hypothetical protein
MPKMIYLTIQNCIMWSCIIFNLLPTKSIISAVKFMYVRWASHVALVVQMRHLYRVLVRKSEERNPLKHQDLDLC